MLSMFLYRFLFPFRFLFRFCFLFLFLFPFLIRNPDSGFPLFQTPLKITVYVEREKAKKEELIYMKYVVSSARRKWFHFSVLTLPLSWISPMKTTSASSDSFVDSCWDQISLHHFFITLWRFDLAKHCYMYFYSFCFGVTSSWLLWSDER